MSNWFKQNAWGLVIAATTIASTFTLYGYRISAVEAQVNLQQKSINKLNDTNTQIQISLATIQTDIQYIKLQVNKITN